MNSTEQAEKLLAACPGADAIMVETDILRGLIGERDAATERADRAHDLAAKHCADLEHERRQHAYWRDRHSVDVQERTAAWQRGNEEIGRLRAEAQEREHALLRLSRDGGRLADEVDALIARRVIDARSPVADALLDFRDPPRSPRSCRLAVLEQELAAAIARAEQAERQRDVLALNQGRPWALPDVLRRLADAVDHLLHDHDCDGHGYEWIGLARDEARLMLTALDKAQNP